MEEINWKCGCGFGNYAIKFKKDSKSLRCFVEALNRICTVFVKSRREDLRGSGQNVIKS